MAHNIDPTGLTQVTKAFAVVQGTDVTYFTDNPESNSFDPNAKDSARELADAVGGALYEVTVEARIIAAKRLDEHEMNADQTVI